MSGAGASPDAPHKSADQSPLAIICGGGTFPGAVAEAVQRQQRPIHLFLIKGFADPALERFPHEWVKLGSLATFLSSCKSRGIKDVVIIGSVVRPRLVQIGLDWKSLLLLSRLAQLFLGGDNSLLSGVAKIFAENGLTVRGPHEVAPELLMPEGLATRLAPGAQEREDIETGRALLFAIDRFDVGQAVVVAGKRVVAIEGAEGTQGLLERVAQMRQNGRLRLAAREGVLVKLPKPSQDRRLDMPAIGNDTIAQAQAAGLTGIAVQAKGALVPDAQGFIEAAERAGIFVVALPPPDRT